MKLPATPFSFLLTVALLPLTAGTASAAAASNMTQDNESLTVCSLSHFTNCIETVDYSPDPIMVNGVEYSTEDGLTHHRIVGNLTDSANTPPTDTAITSRAGAYVNWGSSWARSEEYFQLKYKGTTQAGGNIYGAGRIIQTSITYKRSGTVLSRAVSNAQYYSSSWHAGPIGTAWATDTLNPWAPKTEFYYDYYTVNPNITG